MRLEVTEPAQKALADLDRQIQRHIKAALDRLLSYPQAVDLIKTLKDSPDMWRLKVGHWQAILRPNGEQGTLYVLQVRHRRETYR